MPETNRPDLRFDYNVQKILHTVWHQMIQSQMEIARSSVLCLLIYAQPDPLWGHMSVRPDNITEGVSWRNQVFIILNINKKITRILLTFLEGYVAPSFGYLSESAFREIHLPWRTLIFLTAGY